MVIESKHEEWELLVKLFELADLTNLLKGLISHTYIV